VLRLVLCVRQSGEVGGESGVPGNLGEEAAEDSDSLPWSMRSAIPVLPISAEVPVVLSLAMCLPFGVISPLPTGAEFFCCMCRSVGREAATNDHLGEIGGEWSGVPGGLGEEGAEVSAVDCVLALLVVLATCLARGVTSPVPAGALFFCWTCRGVWGVEAAPDCWWGPALMAASADFLLAASADGLSPLIRRGVMIC